MRRDEVIVALAILVAAVAAVVVALWSQGWLLEFLMPRIYAP